ncbi:MAG: glycosyltransferase family 4 protein [Verrucomicrobiota bacterium]
MGFFANTSWYLANFRMGLLKAAQARGIRVIAIAPLDDYSSSFEEEGLEFRAVSLVRRNYNPIRKWETVRDLKRIYRQEKIDLVHFFTLEAILTGTMAAGRSGPKVIHSVTGMGFIYAGSSMSRRLLRMGLEPLLAGCLRCGPVLVENPADQRTVEKILGEKKRFSIECVPGGGVDIEKFHPSGSEHLDPSSGSVRFLVAGRLLKDKGAGLFVEAVRRYSGPSAEFYLAGLPDEGNPDSYLLSEVEEWETTPGFHWLRNVDDMASLLRSVDVLVHPTFYGEGLPRIIMEAQACGKPVITTNIPACAEAVEEGKNGWVIDQKDPDLLAKKMCAAAQSKDLRREMGSRNRLMAEEKFSEEVATAKTLMAYRAHYPDWDPENCRS